MELITEWAQLATNIRTLARGVASNDSRVRDVHRAMVKQGTCFVIATLDGAIIFAPSRFIGYVDNTLERHIAAERGDGRRTNLAIRAITGDRWQQNTDLEALYAQYCYTLGLEPTKTGRFGAPRKFVDVRDRAISST